MSQEDRLNLEWIVFSICYDLHFFYEAIVYESNFQSCVE